MTAVTDPGSIQRMVQQQAKALEGFDVVAIDGDAGRVAKRHPLADESHLVVHVGGAMGLFGKDVVIELDAVDAIDTETRQIHVDRIVDWVKASPKLDQYAEDHPSAKAG